MLRVMGCGLNWMNILCFYCFGMIKFESEDDSDQWVTRTSAIDSKFILFVVGVVEDDLQCVSFLISWMCWYLPRVLRDWSEVDFCIKLLQLAAFCLIQFFLSNAFSFFNCMMFSGVITVDGSPRSDEARERACEDNYYI